MPISLKDGKNSIYSNNQCAKCGKNLSYFDKHNCRSFTAQLKDGYLDLTMLGNRKADNSELQLLHIPEGKHKFQVPEYSGKTLCDECARNVWWSKDFEKRFKEYSEQNKLQVIITDDVFEKNMISKRIEIISEAGQQIWIYV